MKCPHCGYEDYRAEELNVKDAKAGYTAVLKGDYGDFYSLFGVHMKRTSPNSTIAANDDDEAVYACPSPGCGKLFIRI